MTRRDTIIAAALVNAGLLVVLFVSALKNEQKPGPIALESEPSLRSVRETPLPRERKKSGGVDEVEEVLKRYAGQESYTPPPVAVAIPPVIAVKDPAPVPTPAAEAQILDKTSSLPLFEIEVKKGDVLEKIAKEHRTTVSEIMRLNRLPSTRLKPGQKLKIESGSSVKESGPGLKSSPERGASPGSAKYYTVKAGDNLWTIAVRNHSRVEDLLKLNDLSEEQAKKLQPGDSIRIR